MLGLDVGGTSIKSGLVDASGTLTEVRRTPTPQDDPDGTKTVSALSQLVAQYSSEHKLAGVGLCVPGITNSETGIAEFSGTLGWRHVPIRDMLWKASGVAVSLVHDVTASGIAELKVGAVQGFSSGAVIAIGTGLAVSLILDSKVYHPHSAVGELGHVPTRNSRPCVCGKFGCLEMTCSGGALSRNYAAISGNTLPAHSVIELAELGDEAALALWLEFLDELGFACHYISSLLGPEVIVIAGGFGYLGERITAPLESYLDKALSIQLKPKILTSNLEGTSGCIGAGLFAFESLGSK